MWLKVFLFSLLMIWFNLQPVQSQSPELMTQIGQGVIETATWYPDSSKIMVTTALGIWIYTRDLQEITHIPDAYFTALSPDGKYIAAVDNNSQVRLWDAATFESVESPDNGNTGYFNQVWAVSWSPDSRFLAVSGRNDEPITYLWDMKATPVEAYIAHRDAYTKFVWSPQGSYLAMFYQPKGNLIVMKMADRSYPFYYTASLFSEIDAYIIWKSETLLLHTVTGENTEAILFDIITGEQVKNFSVAPGQMEYSPDGNLLAINGVGSATILNENTNEYQEIPIYPEHFGSRTLKWSHRGDLVAIGTYSFVENQQAEILIFNPQENKTVERIPLGRHYIQSIQWSTHDRYLLVVDSRSSVFTYDRISQTVVGESHRHTLIGWATAWKDDESVIAVADSLENVYLWDVQTGEQLKILPDQNLPVTEIQWQPQGNLIATHTQTQRESAEPNFYLWDTATTEQPLTPIAKQQIYEGVFDWRPDGNQVATVGGKTLYISDLVNPDSSYEFPLGDYQLNGLEDLQWSPSGQYIVLLNHVIHTGGSHIYDTTQNKFTYESYAEILRGRVIWSQNDALTFFMWGSWGDPTPPTSIEPYVAQGIPPDFLIPANQSSGYTLRGLTSNVQEGFISPYGNYVAAIDSENSGFVWNSRNSSPLFMMTNTVNVIWSPDESKLALQREDGSIWILNADGSDLQVLPKSAHQQKAQGSLSWSRSSQYLAHLYSGVLNIWDVKD
jgi:WD40 repeat protein